VPPDVSVAATLALVQRHEEITREYPLEATIAPNFLQMRSRSPGVQSVGLPIPAAMATRSL